MPYGNGTVLGVKTPVIYRQLTPYGVGLTYTNQLDGSVNKLEYWSRSGGFNSRAARAARKRLPLTYVKKSVTLYNGPKLHYQTLIYSRRQKRYVWVRARAPIVVERLVPVYPAKSKKKLVLDAPPTNLYFRKYWVTKWGGISVQTAPHTAAPGYARELTCDLLYGGSYPGGTWTDSPSSLTDNFIVNFHGSKWSSAMSRTSEAALNGMHEKLKNIEVNLGQIFSESRQTASMIADTAVRLAEFFVSAKKGRFDKAFKALFPNSPQKIADDYLMFKYGVQPLLSDLDGMMKHLVKIQGVSRFRDIIVKRTEEIPFFDAASISTGIPKGIGLMTMSGSVTTLYKIRVCVSNADQRAIVENGTLNIPSIGYELLPWSFVLDWFIPIGDYLNNLDALLGLEVVSCHKTTVLKRTTVIRRNFGGVDSDGYLWPKAETGATFNQVEVKREVLNALPSLPYPSLKNPFSAGHIANAIALITQISSRK